MIQVGNITAAWQARELLAQCLPNTQDADALFTALTVEASLDATETRGGSKWEKGGSVYASSVQIMKAQALATLQDVIAHAYEAVKDATTPELYELRQLANLAESLAYERHSN